MSRLSHLSAVWLAGLALALPAVGCSEGGSSVASADASADAQVAETVVQVPCAPTKPTGCCRSCTALFPYFCVAGSWICPSGTVEVADCLKLGGCKGPVDAVSSPETTPTADAGTAADTDGAATADSVPDTVAVADGGADLGPAVDTAADAVPVADAVADVGPAADGGVDADAGPDVPVVADAGPEAVADILSDIDAETTIDTGADIEKDTATDIEKDTAPPCPASTAKPDNSCCPAGQSWDIASAACIQPGPVACAAAADAKACQPKWCLDWLTGSNVACAAWTVGCHPIGRSCTAAEIAKGQGCAPGFAPTASDPTCQPAGATAPLPPLDAGGKPYVVPATATAAKVVVPLAAFVAPGLPKWCSSATGPIACASGCEVGQAAGSNGSCAPVGGPTWTCPPTFVAGTGTAAACVPDPASCGSDPFAGIQDGATTAFVDASFPGTSTGKRAAPYKTIFDATYALAGGGTIAIAAGTYLAAIDSSKNLTIVGRCAAQVKLVGKTGQAVIHGGGGAVLKIQGLALSGGTEIVRIDGPASAELLQVDIGNGARYGVVAKGGAQVKVQNAFVHDMLPTTSDGSLGDGIHADGGSQLTLTGVRLSTNRHRGLDCDDGGTLCTVSNAVIDGTLVEIKTGDGGIGIGAASGAVITATDVRLVGNRTAGVLSFGTGSKIILSGAWIDGTLVSNPTSNNGFGAMALSGATVHLANSRLTANKSGGVRAYGVGSVAKLTAVLVQDTGAGSDLNGGQGLVLGGGAKGEFNLVAAVNNTSEGCQVADTGTLVQANSLHIAATKVSAKDGSGGVGLSVGGSASATLVDLRLIGNRYAGLYCGTATVSLDGAVIAQTLSTQNVGGYGITGQAACALTAKGSVRISANKTIAVYALGSSMDLGGATIDGTLPRDGDLWGGRGLQLESGAKVKLGVGSRLSGNRDIAILVSGSGSVLEATATLLDGTKARTDGKGGRGLHIDGGASATLTDLKVIGNRDVGVAADGNLTSVTLGGTLLVAGTLPRSDGLFGRGVQVSAGAKVVGQPATLWAFDNSEAGIAVIGKDGSVQVTTLQTWGSGKRGSVIQLGGSVHADSWQSWGDHNCAVWVHGSGSSGRAKALAVVDPVGRGLEVSTEGALVAHHALILRPLGAGALVADAGSVLRLVGALIVEPKAGTEASGQGLQVQDEGAVWLAGSRINLVGAAVAGVTARVGKAFVSGTHIERAVATAVGTLAPALAVSHYGTLEAKACHVAGAVGAAVLVYQAKAILDNVVIVATVAGVPGAVHDAVQAQIPLELSIARSWLSGAGRGLLLAGNAAVVNATRIDGMDIGVATTDFAVVTLAATWLGQCKQLVASGGSWPLAVPSGPKVVGVVGGVSEL